MSEFLQSGQHLDADQISAFVESALPAHEREEMLAHLAVCADCREVVALTLPEMGEAVAPEVVIERKRWFWNWRFAWAPALAAASFVVIVVLIHKAGETQKEAGGSNQVALEREAPAAPVPALGLTEQPGGGRVPGPSEGSPRAGAAKMAESGRQLSTAKSVTDLPIEGRNFAALAPLGLGGQRPQVKAGAPVGQVNGPVKTTAGAAFEGAIGGPVARNAPAPVVVPQTQSPTSGAGNATVNVSAESVEVTAAASLQVEPAPVGGSLASNALGSVPLQDKRLRKELPSHLPVLSSVANGDRVLAIDGQNALFFSKDGGKHWKAVPTPWQGLAVRVELTGYRAGAMLMMPIAGGAGQGGVGGVVTDATGAVIPGADVVLTNAATGGARMATTDVSGRYSLGGLEPGVYSIAVRARGFMSESLGNVTVGGSRTIVQDFTLRVGSSTETVEVTADAAVVTKPALRKGRALASGPVGAPAFEVTTDAGQVWTSADGQSWMLKK